MKLAALLSLLISFSIFAQTNTTAAPATTQETVGTPAAGEASMGQEAKPIKKHKKAHHAKKKHHKRKKTHSAL